MVEKILYKVLEIESLVSYLGSWKYLKAFITTFHFQWYSFKRYQMYKSDITAWFDFHCCFGFS